MASPPRASSRRTRTCTRRARISCAASNGGRRPTPPTVGPWRSPRTSPSAPSWRTGVPRSAGGCAPSTEPAGDAADLPPRSTAPTLAPMPSGSILPRLEWARSYRRTDLPHDVFAGIVLTAILVPAGMAYAEAAGLPPIVGLYASIVPLLAYAVLGPSRILVVGPDSSLLPIIAAAIIPLAAGDDARATVLSALLAVIVGAVIIAAGLARFG